ncbi:MAG: hypothetical protein HQM08_09525 [Candidatus Riflebacteria bacterium]|nr:hypothetical protein [Candidatus Riflebacteria bacterium]
MPKDIEIKKKIAEVHRFHTKEAPGLDIGVEMLELALENFGSVKEKFNAVVETPVCLPDVIQVLLGCTTGNRYLKVLPLGRFAFTIFDRYDGRGIRVSIDLSKIDKNITPELFKFFHRTRGPEVEKSMELRKASGEKVIQEFALVGRKIFKLEKVTLKTFGKPDIPPAKICEQCNESFLANTKDCKICDFCSGESVYYTKPV